MKSWFLHHRWYEHWTAHQECLPISLLSAYNELCHVSTVQHLLSLDSKLVSAFVLSRLDNCNSLLSGCPKHLTEELQKVQNPAARLVLKAHKRDQVSPFLRTLHCPPKHLSSIRCQHPVTPFSLIQPLFICLTFSMSTLHQDSSLLIWLKNCTHSAHKDQNIWTSFIFPCCSCLEFPASRN